MNLYKTETDSQAEKINYGYQSGKGGDKLEEFGINIYKQVYKIGKQQGLNYITQETIFNIL